MMSTGIKLCVRDQVTGFTCVDRPHYLAMGWMMLQAWGKDCEAPLSREPCSSSERRLSPLAVCAWGMDVS